MNRFRVPIIFLGLVLVVIFLNRNEAPSLAPETDEQRQARFQAIQQRQAQQKAEDAAGQRRRYLCDLKVLCSKFSEARQACATAGDYKNCLTIKMGNDARDTYPCLNDGTVWNAPQDMPDSFTCFFVRVLPN